jgi:hypothetical protein
MYNPDPETGIQAVVEDITALIENYRLKKKTCRTVIAKLTFLKTSFLCSLSVDVSSWELQTDDK